MKVNRPTVVLVSFCMAIAIAAAADAQTLPSSRKSRIPPEQHPPSLAPCWSVGLGVAPAAPAGFDQERAFVALKDGALKAVDIESGVERWKVELATTVAPDTGDGFVFVAVGEEVVALMEGSGEVAWKVPVGGAITAAPFFDAGTVIVTRADGEVILLRASSGAIVWRRSFGAPLATAPAVGDVPSGLLALDDQLVAGTLGNRVFSIKAENGRERWVWQVGADVMGAAVADERHI